MDRSQQLSAWINNVLTAGRLDGLSHEPAAAWGQRAFVPGVRAAMQPGRLREQFAVDPVAVLRGLKGSPHSHVGDGRAGRTIMVTAKGLASSSIMFLLVTINVAASSPRVLDSPTVIDLNVEAVQRLTTDTQGQLLFRHPQGNVTQLPDGRYRMIGRNEVAEVFIEYGVVIAFLCIDCRAADVTSNPTKPVKADNVCSIEYRTWRKGTFAQELPTISDVHKISWSVDGPQPPVYPMGSTSSGSLRWVLRVVNTSHLRTVRVQENDMIQNDQIVPGPAYELAVGTSKAYSTHMTPGKIVKYLECGEPDPAKVAERETAQTRAAMVQSAVAAVREFLARNQ